MDKKTNFDIEFFDTETVNNKTVFICNSKYGVWNSKGLSFFDCADFLLSNAKKYNYFFRIDYDINMIIKDLPKKNIIELFEKNETIYNKYRLQYYRHKIFIINGKKFYDVSNFFQTSLIKTIEILNIDLTNEEKEFIELMKNKRADFNLKDKDKIIKYSLLENQIGLKIVETIYNLLPNELKTFTLYGSSALANKFLKNKISQSLLFSSDIFINAYFGGRMECLKIGYFENIYKYDINSAYPNIIRDLRQPLTYTIRKYKINEKIIDTNIYEVEFYHSDPSQIGTLPYRLKSGYLVFPKEGKGFYYGCEIKEAKKRGVKLKIKNVCDVKLGKKIFSNNEIETMYKLRLEYKNKNDKKNLIYKILLNSIYGKLAQSVGMKQYRNIYLAGYVTSKVRAELLKATFGKDKDIIFFATDGILSKTRLNLKIDNEIGNFEEIKIKNAFVIQSGIYKLTDYNNKIYLGERGFRFDFDEAIKTIRSGKVYKTKFKTFISNIYAFKNYKVFLNKRCMFTEIEKKLDIKQQHKRIFKTFDIDKENNSTLLNKKHIKTINKNFDMLEFQDFEKFADDYFII